MSTDLGALPTEARLGTEDKFSEDPKGVYRPNSPAADRSSCAGESQADVNEMVIDRLSLSHMDISSMRLRGCRVRAHGSPVPPRCGDASSSSTHSARHQQMAPSPPSSCAPLLRPTRSDEALRRRASPGVSEGIGTPDVAEHRRLDEDDGEELLSGSLCRNAHVSSSHRMALPTAQADSPIPATSFSPVVDDATSCSPFSCVALVHPLSTWKFPALGSNESPCCTTLRVAGDEPVTGSSTVAHGQQSAPLARSLCSQNATGSLSDFQASLRYICRVENVYAIHEAIAVHENDAKSTLAHTVSGSTPHGYYSLGSRRGKQHSNKQVVPVVPQVLQHLHSRNIQENRRLLSLAQYMVFRRKQMDPAILDRVEQRPLLQTTLFAEFTYQAITAKRRSTPLLSLSEEAFGQVENYTHQSPQEVHLRTYVHKDAVSGMSSTSILESSFLSAATKPPRRLTDVRIWNQKRHGIDGISRYVDNEEDNLVVFVGMILMGWLEVVDLLGSGTFGQVFLCKDLRISGSHFVHPNMIDGEDFQYWQCSHDYIPFSDPSFPPKSDPIVAVKVVRSRELFDRQSLLEAEMLTYIGAQTSMDSKVASGMYDRAGEEMCGSRVGLNEAASVDPPAEDPRCASVAKIYAHGVCFGHHCIVLKRYGANLFEYVQSRDFKGLPMYHIQDIGRQILRALTLLHDTCGVVHCDIKPENILLSRYSSSSPTGSVAGKHNGANCGDTSSSAIGGSVAFVGNRSRRGDGAAQVVKSSTKNTSTAVSTACTNNVSATNVPATDNSVSSLLKPLISTPHRMHYFSSNSVPFFHVKLIDFSSSAYINECIYTYVQSRYYRAPEVIILAGYGPPIDVWSTGCLLAELLLGLPLLSGSSDYHQLYLIEEMLGKLPDVLLEKGKQTGKFYEVCTNEMHNNDEENAAKGDGDHSDAASAGAPPKHQYRLLHEEQYMMHNGSPEGEWPKYFRYRTLEELVRKCILSEEERRIAAGHSPCASDARDSAEWQAQTPNQEILEEMIQQRFWLYDLLRRMLSGNPAERMTAREALEHPFLAENPKYMKPYLSDAQCGSIFSL